MEDLAILDLEEEIEFLTCKDILDLLFSIPEEVPDEDN